jgi:VanZ family protein
MSSLARSLPLPSPPPSRSPRWSLLFAWLPTFLWMGVIATESTAIFTAEHTFSWLFRILRVLFGVNFALRHSLFLNEYGRKLGHFTGYGILSFLSFFGWTELLAYHRQMALAAMGKAVNVARRWHMRAAALAVLVTLAVACADEFHQSFIPGRTATFRDVILDTMGGLFAQILILLFWKARMKPSAEIPNQ